MLALVCAVLGVSVLRVMTSTQLWRRLVPGFPSGAAGEMETETSKAEVAQVERAERGGVDQTRQAKDLAPREPPPSPSL